MQAVSASGSATTADTCSHRLEVKVVDGASRHHYFLVMAVLSFIALIIVAIRYGKWKAAGEED